MIYRKRGSIVRWENGVVIRVDEEGVARDDAGVFECEPAGSAHAATVAFPHADLHAVAARIREAAADVTIERLVITDGEASHEYGPRRWSDATRRMHIALTRGQIRVMLDLASFDVEEVAVAARALQRLDTGCRTVPQRIRVAASVTAALLPYLRTAFPDDVRIVQTAGGLDGYGEPIVEAERDWPNWFRPSYRIAPRRMPMNLRIEATAVEIDASLPCAIALLAPPTERRAHVLLDDGARSWPASVQIGKILAVSHRRTWYPYAAGSFGAEMML